MNFTCTLPELEDTTAPVVLLVYPYTGSVLTGNVSITVEATDDKQVISTWYYLDGAIIERSNLPNPTFVLDVTPYVDNQSHVFQAGASDAAGNVGVSQQVQVTLSNRADIIPPVVEIVAPQTGTTSMTNIKVVASASDNQEVDRVAFFIDGDSVSVDNSYPYEYIWAIQEMTPNEAHSVKAKAYDISNNWSLSDPVAVTYIPPSPDTQPPVASIIFPVTGTTENPLIKVVAAASDDRGVAELAFFVNGDSVYSDFDYPYEYMWPIGNLEPLLAHTLQVKAYDTSRNWGLSSVVSISYQPPAPDVSPPSVSILYPPSDTTSASPIKVVASAYDDREVAEVTFLVNGDSVFADDEYPYEYLWPIANWPGGIGQILQAKAYDTSRNWNLSDRVVVTYVLRQDTQPPQITLLYPPAGQDLTGTIVVATNITDNVGVTRVEFYVDGGIGGAPNQVVNTAPWNFTWNTAAWADGQLHTLFIKAYDAAGNVGSNGPLLYTIN
jgi:chitinase